MVQKLALFGFVFTKCPIGYILIIHFYIDTYVHLESTYGLQDWVCFGFVFLISPSVHFHIFTCYKRGYVDLGVLDIGFVLHKRVDL